MAAPKKSALASLRWLLLIPIPILWCFLERGTEPGLPDGKLSFLENKLLDWRFQFRGPVNSPIKVAYVDVDSTSLDEIGGWPWSRTHFAVVAKALIEEGGAKAVGMDYVFSELGVADSVDRTKLIEGNRALGKYLFKTPAVVVAASYVASNFRDVNGHRVMRKLPLVAKGLPPLSQIERPELPTFNVGTSQPFHPPVIGIIDTLNNAGRWVPLYTPTDVKTYFHMALELARIYFGVNRLGVKVEGDYIEFIRPDGSLAAHIPMTDKQLLEINWFSRWIDAAHNPRVSFSWVEAYEQNLHSGNKEAREHAREFFDQFKDAVVLIGPVDPLLQDLASTPMDEVPVPRVGVHGNLLKTIVSGAYLQRLTTKEKDVVIFGLTFLVAGLVVLGAAQARFAKTAAAFSKAIAVLAAAVYVVLSFQLFQTHNLVLPIAGPIGSAFSTSFAALIWQVIEEQKQKGRIKGLFGTYVAPALVERMVESGEEPKLGGVEENITAYFSDIQAFSTFSEKLSPSRLVELMNEYLTACTDIVQAEGGTLDKYIGDAVVAIYGAPLALPDHAHRSCVAALQVHRRVAELRDKWRLEGDKWPEVVHKLQTRIGLNSGLAVVGNMGSHTRFNYTMMGDNVNIAARMESGAKQWGVYSMCTESTMAGCRRTDPDRVLFRKLGWIVVKGRSQTLPIFEITALKEDATDAVRECIALFEEGLGKYLERDWEGALALFRRSAALEPDPLEGETGVESVPAFGRANNPSLVYIGIAEKFLLEPPPRDWDGAYVMKEK